MTQNEGMIRRCASVLAGIPLYDPLRSIYHATLHRAGSRELRVIRSSYAPFVKRGQIVFDIGANRGEHTALILSLGVRVVAVEPNETCARRLCSHFWGRRVSVVQAAVGDDPSEATLHLGSSDTLSTLSERVAAA